MGSRFLCWIQGDFDAGYLYECQFFSEEEKGKMSADMINEPTRHIPVIDSADQPATVLKYRCDRD